MHNVPRGPAFPRHSQLHKLVFSASFPHAGLPGLAWDV
jgi:hypothetical protein